MMRMGRRAWSQFVGSLGAADCSGGAVQLSLLDDVGECLEIRVR